MDRLNRPPLQWGVFPRIKAWQNDDVNKVKKADRLVDSAGSDYVKLEVRKLFSFCVDERYLQFYTTCIFCNQ